MPTIHIYLPDSIYEELKKLAAERGMKITDVARLLIYDGLKRLNSGAADDVVPEAVQPQRREATAGQVNDAVLEKLMQLQAQMEKLKEMFEERMIELEEQIYTLQDELRKVKAKVNRLEDAYEDLVNPVEVETSIPRTKITR